MSGGAATPAPPVSQPVAHTIEAQSYPVASSGMIEPAMPASSSRYSNSRFRRNTIQSGNFLRQVFKYVWGCVFKRTFSFLSFPFSLLFHYFLLSTQAVRSEPNVLTHGSAPNMKQYHAPQSYARTGAPIGVEDVSHAGSMFNDYRWSPPPEFPIPNSDYASPGHITHYPDFSSTYVPNPYPAYRPRTLSNASFIEAWTQPAAPRSPASAASTQPFYWLDVDRADQHHGSFSGSSGVPSYATSDTSIYNYAAEPHQMSYFSTSTTASYRSFDDLDTEEYRLLFPPQPLGIPPIDPQQMNEHLDKYWQEFHPHFPIKHRPTFDFATEKPLCLAAMVAVGAQYSTIVGARAESRTLHEKCLKALAKVCARLLRM